MGEVDGCNQGTGCGSLETKYVTIYGILILCYVIFFIFVLRLCVLMICKKLVRTSRTVFLFLLMFLYIVGKLRGYLSR